MIRPGLSQKQYQEQFGKEILEDFPILESWLQQGFLRKECSGMPDKGYFTLTDLGLGLSDYLGPQLISSDVREKMKEWEASYGG